jgi:hypothetical protein
MTRTNWRRETRETVGKNRSGGVVEYRRWEVRQPSVPRSITSGRSFDDAQPEQKRWFLYAILLLAFSVIAPIRLGAYSMCQVHVLSSRDQLSKNRHRVKADNAVVDAQAWGVCKNHALSDAG